MYRNSYVFTLTTFATVLAGCSSSGLLTTPAGQLSSAAALKPAAISRPASAPGSLSYYRSPAQAPYTGNNFILGPSNSIWYVSGSATSADQITRFAPSSKKKTFTLPSVCGTSAGSVPSGLANGPDGRLWFGSLCGGIGAISVSGSVQSFGLPPNCPDADCNTQLGAVSGSQIWFTSLSEDAKNNLWVGFIDTATGTSKSYSVDAKNASSSEIVQGPDGNFWFAVNSEIGRVTPEGIITLFRSKPKMLSVSVLLFGSDGALWFFSGEGSPKVGRMSTSGKMLSETQIPGVAFDATVAGDGNVWFTTSARSERSSLVEMSSPKAYTVLKADKKYKACVMNGLTNGPDGNLWFGGYTGNSQCSYGVGTLVPDDR